METITDFRCKQTPKPRLCINSQLIVSTDSFKFLGTHTSCTTSDGWNSSEFANTTWFASTHPSSKVSSPPQSLTQEITAHHLQIIGSALPSTESIFLPRVTKWANKIFSDPCRPANHLFQSLPSRLRSLITKSTRIKKSFFPTQQGHWTPSVKLHCGLNLVVVCRSTMALYDYMCVNGLSVTVALCCRCVVYWLHFIIMSYVLYIF